MLNKGKIITGFVVLILLVTGFIQRSAAQTTEFTYQGKLSENNVAATGTYQMQFALFDAASGGVQIGSTLEKLSVSVNNGTFIQPLDFGAAAFPGADRFLEIRVRKNTSEAYTTLTPRQRISSMPYAVRAINAGTASNATQLGGIAANQFVQTTDSRLSDARNPLPGSTSYIQNTTTQQAASNFNISGNGILGGSLTANTLSAANGISTNGAVNAGTQYNIGGNRVFFGSLTSTNTFVGADAGAAGPTNCCNAFFGRDAGKSTTIGGGNSFFGNQAGRDNVGGGDNTFIGAFSGRLNTSGNSNSFLGVSSGISNTTGSDNVFIGVHAGELNTTGSQNTFVGRSAGRANANDFNSFFGFQTGYSNTTGIANSFFGGQAGYNNTEGGLNSFFGNRAGYYNSLGSSNSFFGYSAGHQNTAGYENSFFGTDAGWSNTTGYNNSFFGYLAGRGNTTGYGNSAYGRRAGDTNSSGDFNTFMGYHSNAYGANQSNSTAIGAFAYVKQSNSIVLGSIEGINGATATVNVGIGTTTPADRLHVGGDIRIGNSGTNGCLKNASGGVITGTCSSDLSFKHTVTPFTATLEKLLKLKPVHFYWNTKQFPEKRFGEEQSYGLIAQEVEQVLPELVTEDEEGLKAVDYAKIPLLTLQALKELKEQNDSLKEELEQRQERDKQQQEQIDALKKLVCLQNAQAEVCKNENRIPDKEDKKEK
ncbi:MAG: tail fiber domain-containing protein [Acidobacteriota bacterium]|nr:tail fiber domain-containing protein [Acidobacteriota bacterium]